MGMLTILPQDWQCEIQDGDSLLEAALLAGFRLPNSCRNGTCRTCLCRLQAGQVHYRIEWPGLSAEEKADGWILPCVAEADGDVVISVPAAVMVWPEN